MSILSIGSNNPNLSYILSKNPATIRESGKAFRREIRKGVAYGWFPKDTEFRLWFKDAEHQSSFSDGLGEEFEYLDCTRYGSPYIPIAMITHCLASAAKEKHALDIPNTITEDGQAGTPYLAYAQVSIKVSNLRYLDQLAAHYSSTAAIFSEQIQGKYYKVQVNSNSVFMALNVLQVICLLQSLCDKDTYVRMDTAAVEKYVKIFNRADSPYYPRYLFQMKAITNRALFDKLKGDLGAEGMQLTFGDTRQQRFDAVRTELTGGARLVDIGCGEMFHTLKLASKYDHIDAIDADQEISENNAGKIKGRSIENVEAAQVEVDGPWVTENVDVFDGSDVLLTEVLEHIQYEESVKLMQALLKTEFNKVVITCPNKDFNVHYALDDDQSRHEDHKWEPTFEEFCDLMVTFAAEVDCDVKCSGIGDCVNDSNTSIMAVFTKKGS